MYVTSDTHFGHKFMAELRGYSSVKEMDKDLISVWNWFITPSDVVYHLGDFGFGNAEHTSNIFSQLNGKKHLIRGNHDTKHVERQAWESISDIKTIKVNGTKLVLFHYPMETWANAHHGSLHLHGHCHGTLKNQRNKRMDIGVDTHYGKWPYHLEDLVVILNHEPPYEPVDHHL